MATFVTSNDMLSALTGADVNLKNDGGRTALHYAASKGWLKIAESLISQGAKINLKDKACNFTREFYQCNDILF